MTINRWWMRFLISLLAFSILPGLSIASAAEYIVQPGDTLSGLANRFGTTVEALVEVNEIADPNLIVVGQALTIPDVDQAAVSALENVSQRLWAADFDSCNGQNNLGGDMGVAFTPDSGNVLSESYVSVAGRGCVVELTYEMQAWSAFWLNLQNTDLTEFADHGGYLSFDIRADEPIPYALKIEIKRFCPPPDVAASCGELSVYTVTGISSEWERRRIPLAEFGTVGWAATISSWEDIEELVFTFEAHHSGNNGQVFIDNIAFER